jgi:tryptophan-rich sensory protein
VIGIVWTIIYILSAISLILFKRNTQCCMELSIFYKALDWTCCHRRFSYIGYGRFDHDFGLAVFKGFFPAIATISALGFFCHVSNV